MNSFRALTKDGKMVYGWYVEQLGKSYIFEADWITEKQSLLGAAIEVVPASVAQQVGLKDKNKKEGYENDKVSFGSTRPVYLIKWSICNAGFYLESIDEQKEHLGIANFTVGEIIPPEVKESK